MREFGDLEGFGVLGFGEGFGKGEKRAVGESGDNLEGEIEGGDNIGDEGLEGGDEVDLSIVESVDA